MNILEKIYNLEKDADSFGFRWDNPLQILQQIRSECQEVEEHFKHDSLLEKNSDLQEEISDLMHAAFSLCVFCEFDIEETINLSLDKFLSRMLMVRKLAAENGIDNLSKHSFAERMAYWDAAKERLVLNKRQPDSLIINEIIMKDFDDLVIYSLLDIDKALKSFNNDRALMHDIFKSMVEHEIPESLQVIYKAQVERDWYTIAEIIHKIKGGAMYCGTTKLQHACVYFEKHMKNILMQNPSKNSRLSDANHLDLQNLLNKLLDICDETQVKIKSWLADKKEFFK